jgi:hypothetical protein
MRANRNISHLREHLFNQLDMLCDLSKTVDINRARMVCEVSEQIIDSARVEIQFAAVMKGAVTIPFIENQDGASERPNTPQPALQHDPDDEPFPEPPLTAEERRDRVLNSGPSADHPWVRGLGDRRVHMMGR